MEGASEITVSTSKILILPDRSPSSLFQLNVIPFVVPGSALSVLGAVSSPVSRLLVSVSC